MFFTLLRVVALNSCWMCRNIVIIRDMKNTNFTPALVTEDDHCACPKCAPKASSLTTAQLAFRVLIGASLGVMTCAKGLQLGIPPMLVYPVSWGVMLYVAWALTKYQPPAGHGIGR